MIFEVELNEFLIQYQRKQFIHFLHSKIYKNVIQYNMKKLYMMMTFYVILHNYFKL